MDRYSRPAAGFLVEVISVGPGSAEFHGRVLNKSGRPVSGATVTMFPLEAAVSGFLPSTVTDDQGAYSLIVPALGKISLYASKESAGYPDTRAAVFSPEHAEADVVVASPGRRYEGVDIHLGDPDGSVTFRVVDQKTGVAIRGARITLRKKEDPDVMYSSSIPQTGEITELLARRPLTVKVTASGYQPWEYLDSITGNSSLVLNSYDHRIIRVEMVPVTPNH